MVSLGLKVLTSAKVLVECIRIITVRTSGLVLRAAVKLQVRGNIRVMIRVSVCE